MFDNLGGQTRNVLTFPEVRMNEYTLDSEALLVLVCHLQVIVTHHDSQLFAFLVLQAVCSGQHQAGSNHGTSTVVLEATFA
jgi:hypothetical protein